MIVVSDTSPLNYLILIGCVEILPSMFGQVYAPPEVLTELTHVRSPQPVKDWATSPPSWLVVKSPSNPSAQTTLGPGETAAIALAEELHADWILIDERDGRAEASRRGLKVLGTITLLDRAAALKLIDLATTVDQLKATNFHVAENLLQDLLERDKKRRADFERDDER